MVCACTVKIMYTIDEEDPWKRRFRLKDKVETIPPATIGWLYLIIIFSRRLKVSFNWQFLSLCMEQWGFFSKCQQILSYNVTTICELASYFDAWCIMCNWGFSITCFTSSFSRSIVLLQDHTYLQNIARHFSTRTRIQLMESLRLILMFLRSDSFGWWKVTHFKSRKTECSPRNLFVIGKYQRWYCFIRRTWPIPRAMRVRYFGFNKLWSGVIRPD